MSKDSNGNPARIVGTTANGDVTVRTPNVTGANVLRTNIGSSMAKDDDGNTTPLADADMKDAMALGVVAKTKGNLAEKVTEDTEGNAEKANNIAADAKELSATGLDTPHVSLDLNIAVFIDGR